MKSQLTRNASIALSLLLATACTQSAAGTKPNYVYKDAPSAGVVAKIGGENVSEEQLIGDGDSRAAWMELKRNEHDFKMRRLKDVIKERLVGVEAKKANLPLDAFIEKNVTKGKITISDKDYEKFVKEKNIPKEQLNDQIKGRITDYLTAMKKDEQIQAYVTKLSKNAPIEVYFKKPRHVIDVKAGNGPKWGDDKAKVKIVEFSDFECPFCSKGADVVSEIKKKYKGKVQIEFRHFPLSFHPNARPAAEASMCVNEGSSDKFWKFHDAAFKNQRALAAADLEKYAKDSGADMKKYKECMDSKRTAAAVQEDMSYAESIGVRSTPTFFINGELVAGALPFEDFAEMIDDALAQSK